MRAGRPSKEFNQSKNLLNSAYLFVISTSLIAWNARYEGSIGGFSIPSILALLAFGFMWVHYFAAFLKANFDPNLNTRRTTKLTQIFVLFAIIAHPVAIIIKLESGGFGLPPSSFKNYFGLSGALFVSLGSISLLAFLAYELKGAFKKTPKLWSKVLVLNDVAMLLIIFHGFKLGFVVNSGWFRYVWLAYGLGMLYFIYDAYIKKEKIKRFGEALITSLVVIAMLFLSLAVSGDTRSKVKQPKQSNNSSVSSTSQSYVSQELLNKSDGQDGRPCWLVVGDKVYDATGNAEWKNGQHLPSRGAAKCGQDLTDVLAQSPHGGAVLDKLPLIGRYRNK